MVEYPSYDHTPILISILDDYQIDFIFFCFQPIGMLIIKCLHENQLETTIMAFR